ncbi:MAG: hypothetical protein IKK11_08095 [Oscillospiraceae bacterium]|nr:hypothetical protein [Oscillospiraceae bacterium]
MKKRILSLVMAILMIVSLLPVTALAADADAAVWSCIRIHQNGLDVVLYGTNAGRTEYAKTVDGKITTEGASADDYNIKVSMENSVLKIIFKDLNLVCDSTNDHAITIGYVTQDATNAATTNYSTEITLVGENKIFGNVGNRFMINASNGTTFTGDGSFYMEGSNINVIHNYGGDLTIKDTTVTLRQTGAWRHHVLQMVNGDLIIDNANVNLIDECGASAIYFGDFDALDSSTERGIYIQNGSNVNIENQYKSGVGCYHQPVVNCNGPFVIDSSNVTISNGCLCKFSNKAPEIEGDVIAMYKSQASQEFVPFDVEPGTVFEGTGCANGHDYAFLKVVVRVPCTEEDHIALLETDDGDCSTPIVCPNCLENVLDAIEHSYTDDNDATCNNEDCNVTRKTKPNAVAFRIHGEDLYAWPSDGGAATYFKVVDGLFAQQGDESDYNMKVSYADGVMDVVFNNLVYSRSNNTSLFNFAYYSDTGKYNYAVRITLQGENVITGSGGARLECTPTGGLTITGPGSLYICTTDQVGVVLMREGDLTIKDTTVTIEMKNGSYAGILMEKGSLTVDNSTLTVNATNGSGVAYGAYNGIGTEEQGCYIQNGSNVVMNSKCYHRGLIHTAGPIVFDSSNVELNNTYSCMALNKAPELKGDVIAKYRNSINGPYYLFNVEAGTPFEDSCYNGAGYACLKVTVKLPCTDAEHAALLETDDGDCTTAITCPNCGETLLDAVEHTWTDKDDETCNNEGCTVTRVTYPDWVCVRLIQSGVDIYAIGNTTGRIDYVKTVNGKFTTEGASESDYNLKFAYANGVLKVTMKNMVVVGDATNDHIINIGYAGGTYADGTTNYNYAIEIELIGENKIINTVGNRFFITGGEKGTTFYGSGSFYMEGSNTEVITNLRGDITIKDGATVTLKQTSTWFGYCLQMQAGNLTIDNATVNFINQACASAVHFGTYKVIDTSTDRSVTIKNGANVLLESNKDSTGYCNHMAVVDCYGPFVIDSSNVTINNYGLCRFSNVAPEIKGAAAKYKTQPDNDYVPFDVAAGTVFEDPAPVTSCYFDEDYRFLVVTVCATDHNSLADDGNCTTAVVCPDCGKIVVAAQTAHIAETDDGDCTTAVKCKNCDVIVVAAKSAHTFTNSSDTTCDNEGCTHTRTVAVNAVATLNGVGYATLKDAYDAAEAGDTIVLTKQFNGVGFDIEKAITIDLNGNRYYVTAPADGTTAFRVFAATTIKNGRIYIHANAQSQIDTMIETYANLTVTDVQLRGETLNANAETVRNVYIRSGTVLINGSTLLNHSVRTQYAVSVVQDTTKTMPRVTIDSGVTVYGAVEMNRGSLTIKCTITRDLVYTRGGVYLEGSGSIPAPKNYHFLNGTLTFLKPFRIGETYYDSWAAAYAAAQAGDTIVVTKEYTGAGWYIDKAITIDLNGKVVTVNAPANGSSAVYVAPGAGKVEIRNGRIQIHGNQTAKFDVTVENYADLTLTGLVVKGDGLHKNATTTGYSYALLVKSGTVNLVSNDTYGETRLSPSTKGANAFAFGMATEEGYAAPNVTMTAKVKLYGNVEIHGGSLLCKTNIYKPTTYTAGTVTVAEGGSMRPAAKYKFENGVMVKIKGATIGDEIYATLDDAYAAAQAGDTIVLHMNFTSSGMYIDKNLTIDFNGHYYIARTVGSSYSAIRIAKGAEVTLKNSGEMSRIMIIADKATGFEALIKNNGTLHVENLDLRATSADKNIGGTDVSYVIYNTGTLTTNNVVINKNNDGGEFAYGIYEA